MAPYETQGAGVPPYGLVEFAQDPGRTVLGDLSGPVEDVGLQDLLDAGPVGGEGELPVGLDLVGDLRQDGLGIVVQGLEPPAVAPLRGQLPQVLAHLLGGGAADGVEFGAEGGEGPGGGGVEEVREVPVGGHERGEPPAVEPGAHDPGPDLGGPALVRGGDGPLGEDPEAGDDLPEGETAKRVWARSAAEKLSSYSTRKPPKRRSDEVRK